MAEIRKAVVGFAESVLTTPVRARPKLCLHLYWTIGSKTEDDIMLLEMENIGMGVHSLGKTS